MKLIFKERFNKEINLIHSARVKKETLDIIELAELVSSPSEIPGSKALRHYPGAYRIRLFGELRIVAYFDNKNTFTFISILHRKDAYKELYFLR